MKSDFAIVEVAVPYQAVVVRAAKRKAEIVGARGTASVQIRRLAPADLKPAILLNGRGGCYGALTVDRTLYQFEGALWSTAGEVAAAPEVGQAGRPALSEQEFLALCAAPTAEGFDRFPNPFDMTGAHIRVKDPHFKPRLPNGTEHLVSNRPRLEDLDVRTVMPETRQDLDNAVIDAQRIADSIVLCDGVPLFRCHDPFWKVDAGVISLYHGAEYGPRKWSDLRYDASFRIDKLDLAQRWHDEVLRAGAAQPFAATVFGEIEIFDASALTRDDMKGYTQGLGPLLASMLPYMAEAPSEKVQAWLKARDLARDLDVSWSRAKAEEMLQAFASATAAIAEAKSTASRTTQEIRTAVEQAMAVCQRAQSYDGLKLEASLSVEEDSALESLAGAAP